MLFYQVKKGSNEIDFQNQEDEKERFFLTISSGFCFYERNKQSFVEVKHKIITM